LQIIPTERYRIIPKGGITLSHDNLFPGILSLENRGTIEASRGRQLNFTFSFVFVACPADFVYNASVNGCYKVVTRNAEWSIAGLECRSLHEDAHLLVVNNATEQSAVAAMLDSING